MLGGRSGYKLKVTGAKKYYLVKDNAQARKVLTLQIVSKSNKKKEH